MRHNSAVFYTTYGLIHFAHLTMQANNSLGEASAKLQHVLIHDNKIVPPMTTKTITAFAEQRPSEWHITGKVAPVGKIKEAATLLKSLSISTS